MNKHERIEQLKQETVLFYQPQINLRSGELTGVECLIRWNHPEKGVLSAYNILTYAEEHNILKDINDHVFQIACAQITKWRKIGFDKHVSINIIPEQLENRELVDKIKECIQSGYVDKSSLTLEITEQSNVHHIKNSIEVLTEIGTKIGIRLSVDDFGTGFGTYSYLAVLPIQEVKIERFFTQKIFQERVLKIVSSITKLAHDLGCQVVAEGIETKAELTAIKKIGCDIGQGYYFSKPISGEEFEKKYLHK